MTTAGSISGGSQDDLITVTSDGVDKLPPDLPRMVRLALGYGARLQRGTLDVTLPDGRTVRLGGNGPGPAATMMVKTAGDEMTPSESVTLTLSW